MLLCISNECHFMDQYSFSKSCFLDDDQICLEQTCLRQCLLERGTTLGISFPTHKFCGFFSLFFSLLLLSLLVIIHERRHKYSYQVINNCFRPLKLSCIFRVEVHVINHVSLGLAHD